MNQSFNSLCSEDLGHPTQLYNLNASSYSKACKWSCEARNCEHYVCKQIYNRFLVFSYKHQFHEQDVTENCVSRIQKVCKHAVAYLLKYVVSPPCFCCFLQMFSSRSVSLWWWPACWRQCLSPISSSAPASTVRCLTGSVSSSWDIWLLLFVSLHRKRATESQSSSTHQAEVCYYCHWHQL